MNIRRIIEKTILITICLTIGLYTTLFAKKEIRVGVLYDYTGPLAGAGGVPGGDGTVSYTHLTLPTIYSV